MDENAMFLSAFIKNPKEIGSVIPSSRFLVKELIRSIDFKSAKCIVEYGPGTGCVTKEILKRAGKDCKLICFEINRKMHSHLLRNIKDERMVLINDSAENVKNHLSRLGIGKVDYIVSGIPFSNLPKNKKYSIVKETERNLKNGGKFMLYQYFTNFKAHLRSSFSKISTSFMPLNIPPCFVHVCEKQAHEN